MTTNKTELFGAASKSKPGAKSAEQKDSDIRASKKEAHAEIESQFALLKHLPKQILHPFDLHSDALLELRKAFPEFKAAAAAAAAEEKGESSRGYRLSNKLKGIQLAELQELLCKEIPVAEDKIKMLIEKIDHRHPSQITWNEFQTFMTNEGDRREVVNNAQLYGLSVKRLHEPPERFQMDKKMNEKSTVEFYMPHIVYMKHRSIRMILAFFENNQAKLFDLREFKNLGSLHFPYNLKEEREKLKARAVQMEDDKRRKKAEEAASIQSANMVQSRAKLPKGQLESIDEEPAHSTKSFKLPYNTRQPTKPGTLTITNADSSAERVPLTATNMQKQLLTPSFKVRRCITKPAETDTAASSRNIGLHTPMRKIKSNTTSDYGDLSMQSSFHRNSIRIGPVKRAYGLESEQSRPTSAASSQPRMSASAAKLSRQSAAIAYSDQKSSSFAQVPRSASHTTVRERKQQFSMIAATVEYAESEGKDRPKASAQVTCWRNDPYHFNKIIDNKKRAEEEQKRLRKRFNPQNILGLADFDSPSREEQLNQSTKTEGYLSNFTLNNRQTPFRLIDIEPHLFRDKKEAQSEFDKEMNNYSAQINKVDKRKERKFAEKMERDLRKATESSARKLNPIEKQEVLQSVTKKLCYVPRDEAERQRQLPIKRSEELYAQDNQCKIRMTGMTGRLQKRKKELSVLQKTNCLYYSVGEEPKALLLENPYYQSPNGSDDDHPKSSMIEAGGQSEGTSYGKFMPQEMIIRHVEDLRKEYEECERREAEKRRKKEEQNKGKKRRDMGDPALEEAVNLEHEKKALVRIKTKKDIHVVCTHFCHELGLLAIALIDQEIKLYYINQRGSEIDLVEHFCFKSKKKQQILCMHLAKYAMNGKPILCCGTLTGEICIYYIDWDETDPNYGNNAKKRLDHSTRRLYSLMMPPFDFNSKGPRNYRPGGMQHEIPDVISSEQVIKTPSEKPQTFGSEMDQSVEGGDLRKPALLDPTCQMRDEYWNLLMHTREKKEGPDGIKIWNAVHSRLRQEYHKPPAVSIDQQVLTLTRELSEAKIKSIECIDEYCVQWARRMVNVTPVLFKEAVSQYREVLAKDIEKKHICAAEIHHNKDKRRTISNIRQKQNETEKEPSKTKQKFSEYGQEITGIRYVKDIGLVVTSFEGVIKIFDAFSFQQQWQNGNKNRNQKEHVNITCFDLSSTLGVMATGSDTGSMLLVDPFAYGILNHVDAHKNSKILRLFIYEEQQQIISIGEDRHIIVWDCFRLEKIQSIKDVGTMHSQKLWSAAFDPVQGQLWTGCQKMTQWRSQVDPQVEINALQVQTLSKQMMKERNMLGLAKMSSSNNSLVSMSAHSKNNCVLVSKKSKLVDTLVATKAHSNDGILVVIDSENLLRAWDAITQETAYSYKVPLAQQVTAAAVDKTSSVLAVGSMSGQAKVLNLRSGGELYELPPADKEITCLTFLNGTTENTEFWLAGGCWKGKLILWSEPNETNNFVVTSVGRSGHRLDILTIDASARSIVTSGADGIVFVWNKLAGTCQWQVQLPEPSDAKIEKGGDGGRLKDKLSSNLKNIKEYKAKKPGNSIRKIVVGLQFHPLFANIVFAMQMGGEIYAIDTDTGVVVNEELARAKGAGNEEVALAVVKINSSWALDAAHLHMLVVGDTGKACLFDCSLGAKQSYVGRQKPVFKDKPGLKWTPLNNKKYNGWFQAHQECKTSHDYVNTVKFMPRERMWVTATTSGEVKLWSGCECLPLGQLNSDHWDIQKIRNYVKQNHEQE